MTGLYNALLSFVPVVYMFLGRLHLHFSSLVGLIFIFFIFSSLSGWLNCLGSPTACSIAEPGTPSGALPRATRKRKRRRRPKPRRNRYRRFRRRSLHYHLFRRCLRRRTVGPTIVFARIRQHRRWRRRKESRRANYRVKRRQLKWTKFLTPQQSSYSLWNQHRKADADFLSADSSSFLPFARSGLVPEEALSQFCETRADTFLALPKMITHFENKSFEDGAQDSVHRLNLFQSTLGLDNVKRKATFKDCPLVWDTGASFGLTPFRGDFIDYTECSIPVNDIARTNMVIGMGTTLHKFMLDGKPLYLPCLSYHLPTAEIRLFSPQTYHTIYGGHSVVQGDKVTKYIDMLQLEIEIARDKSNVPMVYKCAVTPSEMEEHGPYIRSALPQYERKVDALGDWSANFGRWKMDCAAVEDEYDHYCGSVGHSMPSVGIGDNQNLSSAQKELLLWHWKLGIGMKRIQELMKVVEVKEPSGAVSTMDRVLIPKIPATAKCPIPLCRSCQLSRAKMKKPNVVKSKAIPSSAGALSREKYLPGDFVSLDQYVIKTPGRLPTGYGKESVTNMFHGGTIFRDAASKYIHVQNQVSLGAGETVNSKIAFEEWLYDTARIAVKHYHSDNGVFTAELFRDSCIEEKQTQSFSGVGAQHQNAEAERAIQTVMYMARSFMVHAAMHWNSDGADDLSLWGFAVDYAAWLYNRIPQRQSGITPMEMITNCKSDHRDLMRAHVWGCPVYVLEAKLQDGKKLPKWNRRARMGQFLGFSRAHSSTVALVRNLHTGYVSPQYHVVFDDNFQTVFSDGKSTAELDKICNELFVESRDCYVEEEFDDDGILIYTPPPLDEVWLSEPERRERRKVLEQQRVRGERRRHVESQEVKRRLERSKEPLPDLCESDVDSDCDSVTSSMDPVRESGGDDEAEKDYWSDHPLNDREEPELPTFEPVPSPRRLPEEAPTSPEEADSPLGRSADGKSRRLRKLHEVSVQVPPGVRRLLHLRRISRKRGEYRKRMAKRRQRADELMLQAEIEVPSIEALMACPLSKFIHFAANDCGYTGTRYELIANWVHPLFLKAKSEASKEDNPNWKQAMSGPFKAEFWEAAVKEVETLESMDAWDVIDRDELLENDNVIDGTWAFKIKRFPDGMVKKFKARFCARGDQQLEGIDFFETYAPVVQWTTVRLMLILEILLQLKSKQGDVTAAFLHAELKPEERVFVEMPLGFRQKGKVLKLKRTLYGLRQSPRAFWQYLTDAMVASGMEVSKMDPCLFVGERVTAVAFVDDILFWSVDEAYINELAAKLRQQGVLLEQEGDAAGFLGVQMTKTEEGLLEMKQTGLIDRILDALGLDSKLATNKWTPAESKPLTRDEDGELPQGSVSYSSVVGMMLYLSGHSRPDIAYAVNCCARYMFCPRLSHEKALKRIGRYLKATRDKGLIFNPSGKLKVDAYPDADFAGLYGHEKVTDPACAKSRTGFLIAVSDCPMVWVSKLQTETALSTMEAEIIALAHCCRELFPVVDTVAELGKVVGLDTSDLVSMHVSVHEDNAGALILAQTIPPQFTPRSKYYAIKTVWFREEIHKRGIKLLKIDTVEQLGDIFTKGLPRATFEYLRKKMMGW